MQENLKRYTELPFLIDYLQTKEMVLINPASWDDRNDSFYIEQYAKLTNKKSVYALCLTRSPETYHHWRVFSHGNSGVCIEFNEEVFLDEINKVDGIQAKKISYKTIKSLRNKELSTQELPFLKRYAFKDEKEFRLFYCSEDKKGPVFRVPVQITAIKKIILSPWLPASVVKQIKQTLTLIDGCHSLHIHKTTLVENEDWKSFVPIKSNKERTL